MLLLLNALTAFPFSHFCSLPLFSVCFSSCAISPPSLPNAFSLAPWSPGSCATPSPALSLPSLSCLSYLCSFRIQTLQGKTCVLVSKFAKHVSRSGCVFCWTTVRHLHRGHTPPKRGKPHKIRLPMESWVDIWRLPPNGYRKKEWDFRWDDVIVLRPLLRGRPSHTQQNSPCPWNQYVVNIFQHVC